MRVSLSTLHSLRSDPPRQLAQPGVFTLQLAQRLRQPFRRCRLILERTCDRPVNISAA